MSWRRRFRRRVSRSRASGPSRSSEPCSVRSSASSSRSPTSTSGAVSWQYSPSTASAVLTSIVGATAALTGFVVTVTVLVVQMATGTFSGGSASLVPRPRAEGDARGSRCTRRSRSRCCGGSMTTSSRTSA